MRETAYGLKKLHLPQPILVVWKGDEVEFSDRRSTTLQQW